MHIRQCQHSARERPEAARVRYRYRQRATLDACHWRLYDRFLYAQKILKCCHERVLVTALSLSRWPCQSRIRIARLTVDQRSILGKSTEGKRISQRIERWNTMLPFRSSLT